MLGSLLGQEALYLLILTTVGIGPASLLVKTDRPGVPLELAPAFGMALCVGVLETVNFVVPLRHGLWFAVLRMAVASIALAVRRSRDALSALRPTAGHVVGLAAVAVIALGVLNHPLVRAGAPGPVAYGIFDATVYLSNIDADKRYTNDKPFGASRLEDSMTAKRDEEAYGELWDLSARSAWGSKWQHQASMTVPAVVSGATGMPGWTLLTPFMVVCLLTAAFGAYSLAVSVARAGPGAATMAGGLVPGSALLQMPQKPLTFWIAAESPAPAYLRLRLVGPPGMRLAGLPQIKQRQAKDGTLSACVRVPGRGARRIAQLSVTPTPPGLGPPPDQYDNAPVPARTVRLAAVRAEQSDCKRL